jgi:AraC-like DNA-binding protein
LYGVELPQALLKDLRHIYSSSRHLERLINDLLDLSKAEIGELDILTEVMDPHDLIEEAFEIMAGSQTRNDHVTWRLLLPDRLPEICVDPGRLRQILLNLLSNAAKFTAAGSITLGAQSTPEHLHIWVEDTGCGIPLHLQQRIFEAFNTAELPRRPEQGIGLGLRVTYELVKLHGGTITLSSQPDIGTTVLIILPLPAPESLAATPSPAIEPALPPTLPLHSDLLPPRASHLTRQAVAWFCDRYASPVSRQEIAESLGVTPGYLTRIFRQELGLTPWEYLTHLRIAHAKELLAHSTISVTEIAGMVGYDDPAYFTRVFLKETGHAPRAFRRLTRKE